MYEYIIDKSIFLWCLNCGFFWYHLLDKLIKYYSQLIIHATIWLYLINVEGTRKSPFGYLHNGNCFRYKSSLHGQTTGEKYSEQQDVYIGSKISSQGTDDKGRMSKSAVKGLGTLPETRDQSQYHHKWDRLTSGASW